MRLLLTPLCKDLLCAAFPVTGTPKLLTPQSRESDSKKCHVVPSTRKWSRPSPLPSPVGMSSSPERPHPNAAHGTQPAQPQQWTQPPATYPSPETMEPPQGDLDLFVPWDQVTVFVPVPATSLPHPQLGLRAYVGVSPELNSRALRNSL